MLYRIKDASITLGNNTILENIDITIKDNEKIGLVGRNGTGKTTLIKGLLNQVELDDGYDKYKIEKIGKFNIGYMEQNIPSNTTITMKEYIEEIYIDIINLEKTIKKLEYNLEINYQEEDLIKYNELLHKYETLDGYKYRQNYEHILKIFGFKQEEKEKKLNEFSGGQITKLSLIKTLLLKPDLLILDEPTNHLDINAIEWLENYLKNYSKSILIVSHDRMFLDNICNIIYEIEYGTTKRYIGNYTNFLKQKEQNYQKQLKDYEYQQKEIKRLQSLVDRFKYKPTKSSMAMSKLKQIERMTLISKPEQENLRTFKTNFIPLSESYRDVLKVKNLSIGYDKILCTLSFNIEKGDKLGIIGDNGIGKSTFLNTLIGKIKPLSGTYKFGEKTDIGYFSQNINNINIDNIVFNEISNTYPNMNNTEVRNLLAAFEFTKEDVYKQIKDLSGGEKVKLSLCKILNDKPNTLILDEPTNHLDIISKSTIEKMLIDYPGTIIVVTHDRYLVNNVCNKLLVFENKEAILYNYGYSEYLEKRIVIKEEKVNKVKTQHKEKYHSNNNLQKIEKEIYKIEDKLNKLNKELLKEEVYLDINKAKKIQEEINNNELKLNKLMENWEKMM